MIIDGNISVLINSDRTTITIYDDNANCTIAEINLTPEQLSLVLSRLMYVPCKIEVNNLEKVGKKHENKQFEFEIPKDIASSTKTKQLQHIAQSKLTDGWIADNYFNSQTSFFTKDKKQYARCTIRRWV